MTRFGPQLAAERLPVCAAPESGIHNIFDLPSKIEGRGGDKLCHEDHIEVFHRVDPKQRGRQAAPLKIPLTHGAAGCSIHCRGKAQPKAHALVTGFRKAPNRHLSERRPTR